MTTPQPGIGFNDALPVQQAKSRLLITLVVDTSSSMNEQGPGGERRIDELNRALAALRAELMKDDVVRRQGEIALVTFGANHVVAVDPTGRTPGRASEPYAPVSQFNPPALQAGGITPMVEGLQYAFELIADRRGRLRAEGIPLSNRPIVYLITDGVPTDASGHRSDNWRSLVPVIRSQEAGKHMLFFALGVAGAEIDMLQGLAPNSSHYLAQLEFSQVLMLVSASIDTGADPTSRSAPAEEVYGQVQTRIERIRTFLDENH
ncbi:VWA domain-containing protein [Nocardia sp. NPDC059240]|uniref:vWA domain-containing protein n=1 Tax=Nocardia sp. NPDC059240 TaxID=3346786 RepID=UPI0036AC58D9